MFMAPPPGRHPGERRDPLNWCNASDPARDVKIQWIPDFAGMTGCWLREDLAWGCLQLIQTSREIGGDLLRCIHQTLDRIDGLLERRLLVRIEPDFNDSLDAL